MFKCTELTVEKPRSSTTAAHKYLYINIMFSVEETDHTILGSLPYSLR